MDPAHASLLALAPALLASCAGALAEPPPASPVVVLAPAAAQVATDDPGPSGPRDMVYVPPGPFLRGCSPADQACYTIESPAAQIQLDGFYIDRVEVTVAAYRACVASGACSDEGLTLHTAERGTWNAADVGLNTTKLLDPAPSGTCNWSPGDKNRSGHPLNCVTWDQATAYCAWAGKRLPTEAEWEKAARGTDQRIYPWGDDPPGCTLTVMKETAPGCGAGHTEPVGSRPRGRSPYGALDMSGNVSEWVSDWYAEDYYQHSPTTNPAGPESGQFRVIRGGSWKVKPEPRNDALRISNRYSFIPTARLDYIGFRCARDAR